MFDNDLFTAPVPHQKAAEIGAPVHGRLKRFTQLENNALDDWADLAMRKPRANALLIILIKHMQDGNVVTVAQSLIGKLMGCSVDTVQRAIKDLVKENWIQVIYLNGSGGVASYAVNSAVAWAQPREQLREAAFHTALFGSRVIADRSLQPASTLNVTKLKKVPQLIDGQVLSRSE